jgi:hypothetical protein
MSDGTRFPPFLMADDFEQMDYVAWRIEQGVLDARNPLLTPARPWEEGILHSHGTVLIDPIDGLWKAWHISEPLSRPKTQATWNDERYLTYLESEDGIVWNRPELSFVSWPGFDRTNILMAPWNSQVSVNIDPHRDPPYEMFLIRSGDMPTGIYRFRSEDGKTWDLKAGPLNATMTDGSGVFRIDGDYVAFPKTELPAFPGGLAPWDIADGYVRCIGRRTSPDGVTWSDPADLVITPDWRDSPDTQFMELDLAEAPGGFVAYLAVYHNYTQKIDGQWAASRDGVSWWRPERIPCLPNPPLGEPGGGMIWPMQRPVVDGNDFHVYFCGTEGLHGDLYNTERSGVRPLRARGESINRQSSSIAYHGGLCRATWKMGRWWALASAQGGPYPGVAVTKPIRLVGKRIRVNASTRKGGELRVELLDGSGNPVDGFTESDCAPVRADANIQDLQWRGGRVAPPAAEKIRFILRRAFLYGFGAVD